MTDGTHKVEENDAATSPNERVVMEHVALAREGLMLLIKGGAFNNNGLDMRVAEQTLEHLNKAINAA